MPPQRPDESTAADPMRDVTDRIAAFESGLRRACAAAGRVRGDVRLIAVTKFEPAAVAAHALRCGITELGENKAQELTAKREELDRLAVGSGPDALPDPLTWHFVGRLQRNKAKQVVAAADVIHSVDRIALAESVIKAVRASDRWNSTRRLRVLIQVDLDPARRPGDQDSDAARGGVHPDDIGALADVLVGCDEITLDGVMAIAPLDHQPEPSFARLAEASRRLREQHPAAVEISAGMTHDYPVALAHGATMIRVGTALFGDRPNPSDRHTRSDRR